MSRTFGPGGEVIILPAQLAPDLTFPSLVNVNGLYAITLDASAGLTTAISLIGGKFSLSYARFFNMSGVSTFKLTVDGVVIWNGSNPANPSIQTLIGYTASALEEISCQESILLEVEVVGDTSVDLEYRARPIL